MNKKNTNPDLLYALRTILSPVHVNVLSDEEFEQYDLSRIENPDEFSAAYITFFRNLLLGLPDSTFSSFSRLVVGERSAVTIALRDEIDMQGNYLFDMDCVSYEFVANFIIRILNQASEERKKPST